MKAKELTIFREALRCLPFNGIRIKEFGERIHVRPHTLYNYISGQIPSIKNYRYILYTLERDCPAALLQARDITEQQEGKNNVLY